MKLTKIVQRLFFGCSILLYGLLFSMEERKEESLPIQNFDFTFPLISKDISGAKEEWVIVDNEYIPQLDLSLFDTEQHNQKNILFSKGKLFEYNPEVIKNVFKKFANVKDHALRTLHRYAPERINEQAKPISYFVIHGTNGRETEGYYKPKTLLFKNILNYAAQKANKQQVPIDVYSYEWSGENDDNARIYAGMLLGYILNTIRAWYQGHNIFAFSHGCNVGFVATNQLEFKIHEYIAIAPPILENGAWFYAPHNIYDLFPFCSRHDLVRWLGYKWANSYDNSCAKYKGFCKKGLKESPFDEEGHVYKFSCDGSLINSAYTEDNYAPGHCETPEFISHYLSIIMETIRKNFMYKDVVRTLSLNIVAQKTLAKKKLETDEAFDLCNLSLFPQNKEEGELYSSTLPKEMLDLSKKNEDDHFKLYGVKKNEESWWDTYYYLFSKIYN